MQSERSDFDILISLIVGTSPETIYEARVDLREATWTGVLKSGPDILGTGVWHYDHSQFDSTARKEAR